LVLAFNDEGGTVSSLTFAYTAVPESSYLSFLAEPIPEDGVRLELLDANGNPLEEVIPYGPQEARTINFKTSASSAFGANDIDTMSILMVSSQGSTIVNVSTDRPQPEGGEEWTYFNHTYVLTEGTPTDTYTIIVTAETKSGYIEQTEGTINVRPGLFLTMEEDEKDADAGDVITFQMDVLNGGDANDRVTFSAQSQRGWSVDVPEAKEIEGGEEETIEFNVYVPLRSQINDIDEIQFRAESRNAEKTYSLTGTITVISAASYGMEPIGDTTKALMSGTVTIFQVRVINIHNITKTFEMSTEDLPGSWAVAYSSDGGDLQGSLYIFEVNGSGEEVVDIVITTSSGGPYGSTQIGTYVRARGESEKKYTYFTLKVVDDSINVVEIPGDDTRKTASRIGSTYPVVYTKVFFTFELYNPTLEDLDIELDVDEPVGWTHAVDYDDISLTPGSGSLWNLSITPKSGESWNLGNAYRVDVSINAGSEGEFSKTLEVILPEVSDIRAKKEWSSINTVEGKTIPLNITFDNKGNRDETVTITIESSQELIVNLSPMSKSIKPGEEFTARGQIKVGSIGEVGSYSLKLKYSTSKGDTSLDYSLFVEKDDSSTSVDIVPILIGAGVIVALGVVGFVLFNRYRSGSKEEKDDKKSPKPKPFDKVTVTSSPDPPKRTASFRPASAEESKVIKEADEALASILGEGGPKKAPEVEKFEVVEATVVE
jgi:hypothetical protein